jgi:hypothetical protein
MLQFVHAAKRNDSIKNRKHRKQFTTLPIAPQIQAFFQSIEGANSMQYRRQYTDILIAELARNNNRTTSMYRDIFDGHNYLQAVMAEEIQENDTVLVLSIDGAQLYRNKQSDCWMCIFLVIDLVPGKRYLKKHILPGGIIPGPSKPKNLDSFLFPGLFHLAAVQNEGLNVWNALTKTYFMSNLYLLLGTADGPAMAYLNGRVGHHGRVHCRFQCPIIGRHKPGGAHYYPARFKPTGYNLAGCNHPDVNIKKELREFNSTLAAKKYRKDLCIVMHSQNKAQFDRNRLETGICKPTIFLGFRSDRILGIPACFGGDSMHLTALNIPDLLITLWRGTISVDDTDKRSSWTWMALKDADVWRRHGEEVASSKPYIPGSFDRCPRNPAEKLNSGYKAWEYLLYIFGLGPCLFSGILPPAYWENYCKLVRGVHLLLQEEIKLLELKEAEKLLAEFTDDFENLYVQ